MGSEADGKMATKMAAATNLPHALHGVLANELRHKILMCCGERPYSATELAAELDLPRRQITDQIEVLKKTEPPLLEWVGKKPSPKRGSMHMYKATRFNLSVDDWAALSPLEKAVSSTNIANLITEDLGRGLRDETLYASDDHVLLRDRQPLDAQAMTETRILLDAFYDRFVEIATAATERLDHSGERPIPVTLGLILGEVAPKRRRATTPKILGS